MQRYTARNSFSGVLGYIFSKLFSHLSAKGPNFCRNFGLKVPDAHPYPRLYRSAPPPPPPRNNNSLIWLAKAMTVTSVPTNNNDSHLILSRGLLFRGSWKGTVKSKASRQIPWLCSDYVPHVSSIVPLSCHIVPQIILSPFNFLNF